MCLAAITRPTRTNVVRQGNKFPPPAKKMRNKGLIWIRGNLFSGVVMVLLGVEYMTFSQSPPFANYKE